MPAPETETPVSTLTKDELQGEMDILDDMLKNDGDTINKAGIDAAKELIEENRGRFIALGTKGTEIAIKSAIDKPVDTPELAIEPFTDPGYQQANEDNWRTNK